jgi:hypothetical protein
VSEAVDAPGLPADVAALIGVRQYEERAEFPVERAYIWNTLAAVHNGNPLFWDDAVASSITGGPVAPPTTLSLWMRPHYWSPGHAGERLALRVHFDMSSTRPTRRRGSSATSPTGRGRTAASAA